MQPQAWKTKGRAFGSDSELEDSGICDEELKINALISELWKRGGQARYENMQLLIVNYIPVCSHKEGTPSLSLHIEEMGDLTLKVASHVFKTETFS